MSYTRLVLGVFVLAVGGGSSVVAAEAGLRRAAAIQDPDVVRLAGRGAECDLDRSTGRIVRLVHAAGEDVFVSPQTGPAGLEVFDELNRKRYTDLATPARAEESAANERQVTFPKRFEGDAVRVAVHVAGQWGWDAAVRRGISGEGRGTGKHPDQRRPAGHAAAYELVGFAACAGGCAG